MLYMDSLWSLFYSQTPEPCVMWVNWFPIQCLEKWPQWTERCFWHIVRFLCPWARRSPHDIHTATTNAFGTSRQIAKAQWHIISNLDSHPHTYWLFLKCTPQSTPNMKLLLKDNAASSLEASYASQSSVSSQQQLWWWAVLAKREELLGDQPVKMTSFCCHLVFPTIEYISQQFLHL